MIRYFVSYLTHGRAAGRGEVHRDKPITSIGDIRQIERDIATNVRTPVVVVSFQRFDEPGPTSADQVTEGEVEEAMALLRRWGMRPGAKSDVAAVIFWLAKEDNPHISGWAWNEALKRFDEPEEN